MFVTPVLGKLRQEDYATSSRSFKASLGYIVCQRIVWVTFQDPISYLSPREIKRKKIGLNTKED